MRSILWQLGILGTVSAFTWRHRKTRETLCQDGRPACRRTYRMPTDSQPAVRQSPTDLYSGSGVLYAVRTECL